MKQPDVILVINSGSSSLKFTVYSIAQGNKRLANGLVERIGAANANLVYKKGDGAKTEEIVKAANHTEALEIVTKIIADPERGVIASLDEVDAIGHRVVHGGEIFKSSTLVDADVVGKLKGLIPLAPLHNPPNIDGIEACFTVFKGKPNVAVFDTAFHQTMPDYVSHYAIPEEYYKAYGIRKYGFHGTSHRFVMLAAAKYLGKAPEELNLITCHLGNGSSLAAIQRGKVLDTTMGMTPLAGLVMGSRCGHIDPAVILTLARNGKTIDEIDAILNKQSGLLGVGGINSGDMRDIVNNAAANVPSAQTALAMWAHRTLIFIGGYATVLGDVDAVVFTGGIGENSAAARDKIASRLGAIGVDYDKEANDSKRGPCHISKPGSKVAAIVIPTDEELMIAEETFDVVSKQ